jgi:hypothetical protein
MKKNQHVVKTDNDLDVKDEKNTRFTSSSQESPAKPMDGEDLSFLKQVKFSDPIKKLEELMSQNKRSFLIGAGCSLCAGLLLTTQLTTEVKNDSTLLGSTKDVLQIIETKFSGSVTATIEDYMSELVDLLSIAERREESKSTNTKIDIDGKTYEAKQLRDALKDIKSSIARCIESRKLNISSHREFVRAVHQILRSGKGNGVNSVDYFILNYDTLIEDVLALERLSYSDGFSGGSTAWWDDSVFSQDGIRARVFKIHGSIDWVQLDEDPLPRRIRLSGQNFTDINLKDKVMIWPAATKYQESQKDPFAQILAVMRVALRPAVHSETVIAICGYRFGDSHINIEIDRALRESEGRLTVLIFTENDCPVGQLKLWFDDVTVREQVRIYAKRGFYHGQTSVTSETDMPWWKFEVLTRILGGER